MSKQPIAITYKGKPATTVDLAAAEHGLNHDAMSKAIRRGNVQPFLDDDGQPARIGRIALYPDAAVRRVLRERPGVPGRPAKNGSAPTA